MEQNHPKILTFAASDPTGGAGIQADIMTQTSLGCFPLSVITALTVQDTQGVKSLEPVSATLVNHQARALLDETKIDVIKCGVLGDVENIKVIAKIISDYPNIPVVIDPIIASGRGDRLITDEGLEMMIRLLFPVAEIITPNINEASLIITKNLFEEIKEDQFFIGKSLLEFGPKNILLTAADHDLTSPKVKNILFNHSGSTVTFEYQRLLLKYHGSGCTLSSSIAAYIAMGMTTEGAVAEAQDFTWQTLRYGLKNGRGQLIPNRFYWMTNDPEEDNEPKHH